MKAIKEYQIIDHGVEHEQYFQGCGVAFTKFDVVYTGIGNSLKDALDDAVEQLANEVDYGTCPMLVRECIEADDTLTVGYDAGDDDMHHYASIRVSFETLNVK